jgi:hypothetical protein
MTLPTLLFALILGLLYGALYHFVRGGNGWRLLLYFGLSLLGFAVGQLVGAWREWNLFMLGSLNLGLGTVGSILFLVGGEWLSHIEVNNQSSV